ncbi:MAG: hypothetical protein Q9195_003294 [Heterodermia aff. obscurata]
MPKAKGSDKELGRLKHEVKNLQQELYDVQKRYDALLEKTQKQNIQTTNWTYEQLLKRHIDLSREHVDKIRDCEALRRNCQKVSDEHEEELHYAEEIIGDLEEQLKAAKLEAKTKSEAYDSVKSELEEVIASNAESATRYQEWRELMLRVANGAPMLGKGE